MAGRESYPEELPRKRAKKESKEEALPALGGSILDSIGVNLSEEQPRLFEVRPGIRKEVGGEGSKLNLLEKNAAVVIDKICEEMELDKKGAILEIMESAMKEFYSRISDKLNGLQVKQPDKVKITANPKAVLKEKLTVLHNQRKGELSGSIKEIDLIKILNLGKWKLKSLPSSI